MKDLQRRAKRVVWLNPEHQQQWGIGDSDMWDYVPLCDNVDVVGIWGWGERRTLLLVALVWPY